MSHIRHHIAFIVVLSLVLSGASLLVTQGAFMLRRGFIAEHLCENRFKPDSTCRGICYLEKQLHEHEDDQQGDQAVIPSTLVMVWDLPQAAPHLTAPDPTLRTFPLVDDADTGAVLATDVFRPPRHHHG